MVRQNVVNDMLKNIKDPKLQRLYGGIVNGNITAIVKCMSTVCKGRVIAHITSDGRVEETPPEMNKTAPKGKLKVSRALYASGLEGSRQRFDGQWGFRCYCGNNSILCEEEKGIITPQRPTPDDLVKIAKRLERRKGNEYNVQKGKLSVDGFVIEEVKV